ncbi:MAG: hypothetical protein OEY03_04915 [Rhizobacter sp.]|nr:hypothetical protein [Rhizobacter sp.]
MHIDGLPNAAMLLSFDIVEQAQREHDDWHSHEHLPERLAIPGFVRGSRWRALAGGQSYFVMYEVESLGVLASPAYVDRLNHPSPWTAKMMPSYRGMRRGLCDVVARAGHGLGGFGLLLRFGVEAQGAAMWRDWLAGELLPALPSQAGVVSAGLFRSGLQAATTVEQRIRGQDAAVDGALLVTGYAREPLDALACGALLPSALERRGAIAVESATYQLVHCLGASDLAAD